MAVCLWDRWWVPLLRGSECLVCSVLKASFVYPQDFSNIFVAVSASLPEASALFGGLLGLCTPLCDAAPWGHDCG